MNSQTEEGFGCAGMKPSRNVSCWVSHCNKLLYKKW